MKNKIFGVIHERSTVDAQPIVVGELIDLKATKDDNSVVFVRDNQGRVFETYSKFFITDKNELIKLKNEINKRLSALKAHETKALATINSIEPFLRNSIHKKVTQDLVMRLAESTKKCNEAWNVIYNVSKSIYRLENAEISITEIITKIND